MKKLKVLLSVVLTCVLALSIAGCATNDTGDDGNGNGNEDVLTLALIEVDASNAKTEYFIGEEFTADGLVVTRSGRNETTGTSFFGQEVSLEDCSIDKSEFKSDTVGEYTITVSYTLGEITKSDDYTVKVVREVRPYRLVLDESGAQKSFSVGEEFTSDGLSVTAFDYNYKTQTELEPRDVTADIDVDASAYNKDVPGNYDIVVSYTQNETTINATYSVAVKLGAGLDIVLPEEAVVDASGALTVDLVKGGTSVDLTGWVVNQVDANGNVDEVVTEDITYSVYNGDTEVELTSNSFTALQAGTYNVWATLEGYKIPGSDNTYTLKHFVLVYVMDSLQSITLNAEGSVLTQEAGSDVISDTWTFTATYSSGETKQLTSEQVEIEGLTTTAVTDSGVATVTYTEQNAKGETMSVDTTVNYVITEAAGGEAITVIIGTEEMAAIAGTLTTETKINDYVSVTAGADSTVVVESNSKTCAEDGKSFGYRMKLGGEGTSTQRSLKIVTAEDNAKIVIYAMSSSSSATRTAALYDSTFVDKTTTPDAIVGETVSIPGDQLYKYEFTVATAGTYYFACQGSGLNVYGIEIYNPAPAPKAENVIIGTEEMAAIAGTLTTETKINDYVSVTAGADSTVVVESNSKTCAEDGKSFGYRMKLGGEGTSTQRSLKIVTAEDNAKIVIYAMSSSSSATRTAALYDSTFVDKTTTPDAIVGETVSIPGDQLYKYEFTVATAGTYYFACQGSGLNVYGIEILYN